MDVIRKLLLLLLCVFCISQAQEVFNYSLKSFVIKDFKADSLKYTPAFSLTDFENLSIDVMLNDVDAAGYASDSIKSFYWLECGHRTTDYTGAACTLWTRANPLNIDTFYTTSTTLAPSPMILQSDGTYSLPLKSVDTLNSIGYAVQHRGFPIPWDALGRVGMKGLSGNNTGSFLRTRIDIGQRKYVKNKDKDVD